MIEIVGGALNQWDTGRVVHITGVEAEYAHFANKGDSKAVIMGVVDIEAKIPDYLLQTGKPLCVYAVKDGVTIESRTFSVRNRERPENYVYEDDQRNYIYELIANAEMATAAAYYAAENANPSADKANTAAENANKATDSATEAADIAILAAKSATEAAAKAAHTAKSLMVVGEAKGANVTLDDAIDQYLVGLRIFGKSTQDGTPTPDAPVNIVSVEKPAVSVNGQTLVVPYALHGIPVSSDGNYTDANGQQWICDEIDFARGLHVQRVGAFTPDGTEKWVLSETANVFGHTKLSDITYTNIGYCSHFINRSTAAATLKNGAYTLRASGSVYIRHDGCSTVNEFNAWLTEQYNAGTPVVLCYHLATPVETPLSAEELAAYASLHTYRGSTTVSNDAGAWMDLEYVMDAKKYIDSMISASILEATVE